MGKKHSGAAFQSRLNQQRQRQPASSNNGVKGFVGGTTAAKERRVRFVRARRPDRPLVDVDLLRNVIVLNGDVAAFEDAGATMIAETHEHRRGMSTRGNDRGDDLYALCDVRMKWAGARRAGARDGNEDDARRRKHVLSEFGPPVLDAYTGVGELRAARRAQEI